MMLPSARYPLLFQAVSGPKHVTAAIEALHAGAAAGAIRNAVLTEAKFYLNRAVDNAWEHHIMKPFFWGTAGTLPEDLEELGWDVRASNLHDLLSASRKLAATKASGAMVDAMRALVAELLPLAQMAADLKGKVVKGRAPSAQPAKPVNPDQIVRTCPCCFRQIAVVRGRMAHHGYRRPGPGRQTASCPGVRFAPLEESLEGLEWLIGQTRLTLNDKTAQKARIHSGALSVIPVLERGTLRDVTRADPDWQRTLDWHLASVDRDMRHLAAELAALTARLEAWRQKHQGGPEGPPALA